jgi:hypothetical protein
MSSTQLFRLGGLALVTVAVAVVAHLAARSALTAGAAGVVLLPRAPPRRRSAAR